MGAGSAKGVNNINDEDDLDIDNDRFSIISHSSPVLETKRPKTSNGTINNNNNNGKTNVMAKMEALSAESDEDIPATAKSAEPTEKREDEKKRGLFGFSRKKDEEEKTSAFVHEADDDQKKNNKKDGSKGFRFFNFRKESKKSEEKDEKLDQEIKDLQRTFDSLGIVGKAMWDDDSKKGDNKSKKSQSADDIRDLEPMRNRMNQRRRFSRPANAGTSIRRADGTSSSGGSRRTFKYSWETENITNNVSPVKSEDWRYETITIDGFDLEKFKKANFEGSLLSGSVATRLPNSIGSESPQSTSSGIKSPLMYDPMEQKLLATIERDYM